MKDTSLAFIGYSLLVGFFVLTLSNIGLFFLLYADTFTPLELPYTENFDENRRITWRQHGGTWVVRDGAMIQTNDAGTDLMNVIPLQVKPEQSYQFSVDLRFVRGRTGGGLMFNMQHSDTRQESHMVRFGQGDDGQGYLVYGTFDKDFIFKTQGTQLVNLENRENLAVQIHNNTYDVLINDQIVASNIEIVYAGGYAALTSWFSIVAYDNVSLIPINDDNLIVDFVESSEPIPSVTEDEQVETPAYFYDDFTTDQIGERWIPISGQWQIQDKTFQQKQLDGFDLTARSSSQYESFVFTSRFSHTGDSGAGIIFNMPNEDNLLGAHMVRFFPDGAFVWGYFDEEDGFTGQGFLPMETSIGRNEIITVVANGQTYGISLNGVDVVKDVPLITSSGYVGLTTSQTTAVFEEAEVRSPFVESLISSLQTSNGDWSTNGSIITQNSDLNGNFQRSLGVYGEVFTAQVIIQLPSRRSNAQAGLLFHAPEMQNIRGAHWVRLANDGIQITWGVVANDLSYVQNGVADLDTTVAQSRLLTLLVQADTYDILIDNKIIEQSIPLQRSGGWLGFSASGGPTQFSNFKLSLTQ